MEAKDHASAGGGAGCKADEAKAEAKDASADAPPPLAPCLQLVAKHFAARRAALGEAADEYDGVECLYGDFVAENADEFDEWDAGGGDGSGHGHDLKALHDEYLGLLTADVERAVAATAFTTDDFLRDVQAARADGLSERWDALAEGAWFNEALWAARVPRLFFFFGVLADRGAGARHRRIRGRHEGRRGPPARGHGPEARHPHPPQRRQVTVHGVLWRPGALLVGVCLCHRCYSHERGFAG